ncbi:coiled-coil domain-containing protein 190 [Ictalurus furcatus]|uniref:coiled-coil domain-containing protein 190 n=1 Tax=Ictalurus furcatus TaxID=66913 RepID=UPI002350EE77|nr:coiled-coil domain-containing protein 190 [Ictalurus furcatus]
MRRTDWLVWPSEALKREERRAEARLAHGIQRLDEAKRYHLNTLTREQHGLHRHLIALNTGNRWRGLNSVGSRPSNHDLTHPAVSYSKTRLPIIPPADRETNRHRSGKPQSICSLQARVQDFLSSGENRADNATMPVCLPDLKPRPPSSMLPPANPERENKAGDRDGQNKKHRARGREGLRSALETRGFSSKDSQRENDQIVASYTEKEEEMTVTIPYSTPLSPLSDTHASDGQLRMVHTLPNFVQALAEARKARYIRYRGHPLCERELSIREIFSSNSKDTNNTH